MNVNVYCQLKIFLTKYNIFVKVIVIQRLTINNGKNKKIKEIRKREYGAEILCRKNSNKSEKIHEQEKKVITI